MVQQVTEHGVSTSVDTVHYCFLNPAWLPEWFWLPTAHAIEESGAAYFIPPLERDSITTDLEANVDIVAATMDDRPSQYIVALSRGVEYAVRYIHRMNKQGRLGNILGWTVISSAGPSGYERTLRKAGDTINRHTQDYMAGIALDESGLEVIRTEAAHDCLLHDVRDGRLRDTILTNLTKARPLTAAEIDSVPSMESTRLPLTWYIGRNDKVDNVEVSATVAQTIFQVEPILTDWGHIGPLTHTGEVVEALLKDTERAQTMREAKP